MSFRDSGDVFLPIRASCSYPGLFQPVHAAGRLSDLYRTTSKSRQEPVRDDVMNMLEIGASMR